MPPIDCVANTLLWFKRDLRVRDHAALCAASQSARMLALFVWEPAVHGVAGVQVPDCSARHRRFIAQSLDALDAELSALGSGLFRMTGDAVEVLAAIHAVWPFGRLVSHQETGNAATFERDLRVAAWCREHNVVWDEFAQDGVIRRLKSRNGWSKRWDTRIRRPLHGVSERLPPAPREVMAQLERMRWPLPVSPQATSFEQTGGSRAALDTLNAFLQDKGETYRTGMSSPLTGPDVCSRISPHLAHGTLSLSMAVEALNAHRAVLQAEPASAARSRWLASLKSFEGRLYWHCHFMQKLESAPAIEHRNMVRAFDGMREGDFSQEYFARWSAGQTGYPLVDACMRMLAATGWLNFRMRAMLVSFAAFPLWLHWREPGLHLARLFTDYEPGIHWSQMQMQSGTTGINAVRIYNPVKQARDHDPDGAFVRRWCPELAALPTEWLFEPWKLPAGLQQHFGVRIGVDYPAPVVDFAAATRAARERMAAFRRRDAVRSEAAEVMARHGSRKSGIRQRGERPSAAKARGQKPVSPQIGLDFGD
ncbi:MAG: deoxyribodipyrimidine photolyase [Rhodocyclaceae bacterium]|nr:deoxyribodipyrimidine photolyase [Rhodocyclaceae bacterium]